jgi:hypothetical protein
MKSLKCRKILESLAIILYKVRKLGSFTIYRFNIATMQFKTSMIFLLIVSL